MNSNQILDEFRNIRKFKRKGQPVPYKSLVLLFALSQHQRGVHAIPFNDAEQKLKALATRYRLGSMKVEYPFWRLQNDGVWKVSTQHEVRPNSQGDVSRKQLMDANAHGNLREDIIQLIQQDPDFRNKLIELCLTDVDPEARGSLRAELGL